MTDIHASRSYTESDIQRLFSSATLRRAQDYLRRVSRLTLSPKHIGADVQGTERQPYRVDVEFAANAPLFADVGQRWLIEPNCSCPVGYACKHAAAVMLLALKERDKAPQINPEVAKWAETLRIEAGRPASVPTGPRTKISQAIYYVVGPNAWRDGLYLHLLKGRFDAGHRPSSSTSPWSNLDRALLAPPQFADAADLDIFRLMMRIVGRHGEWGEIPLTGLVGADLLERVLHTGRAYYGQAGQNLNASFIPLVLGRERPATLTWQPEEGDLLRARLLTTPAAAHIAGTEPPWFIDTRQGEAGPVSSAASPRILSRLLALPALAPIDVEVVAELLQETAPELPSPAHDATRNLRLIDVAPTPVLRLDTAKPWSIQAHRGYESNYGQISYDYAVVEFQYGEVTLSPRDTSEFTTLPGGEAVRVKRRPAEEKHYLAQIKEYGFAPPPRHALQFYSNNAPAGLLGLDSEAAWNSFFRDLAPRLREAGWLIDFPQEFRHHLSVAGDWDVQVEDDASGWFSVSLGIEIEGQRVELAPLLHALFARDPRWLETARLNSIHNDEQIVLIDAENRRVGVAAERLKPLARTLIDLFDKLPTSGTLHVSKYDAERIAAITEEGEWRSDGLDAVQRFAATLPGARQPQAVALPAGLALALRPYQHEGLNWLQHLREHGLAGILADDMGLGKTAQTLAHLLVEKEAGRLDRPALIVLPTSLIFNWQREAERFAPGLRVLALHGKVRQEAFAEIPEHDVCLTTYPLLWRDEDVLAAQPWHLLILDEAQTVKNASSKAAVVVRKLIARHRLCLTGTPLENHLGELWAQFDFLLPGFLGDARQFTNTWRTPIEKHGNALRRELLARRIKPFILRRRKDDVAKELPPKTIIVRAVTLDGGQRDLYETVRSTMDKQVRDAIAAKGFARSQIVILDALLKLRQVCCDPRLLKLPAAAKVKERAKLDLLMGMLPEMIDEGRRVLLFSQFTGMLDLIGAELDKAKLPFVRLDGQTTDRQTPIQRFQNEEVPIFLISLKAGGVGLNLTAADTVIHYDPWWNPAAENQATDRAHRIGQDKPVFVYKLVVAGSIEEKILSLQARKAELAAGILSEDYEGSAKFGETDVAALLEPLPSGPE
jgi:superfamily II DNA or RNA helicase